MDLVIIRVPVTVSHSDGRQRTCIGIEDQLDSTRSVRMMSVFDPDHDLFRYRSISYIVHIYRHEHLRISTQIFHANVLPFLLIDTIPLDQLMLNVYLRISQLGTQIFNEE